MRLSQFVRECNKFSAARILYNQMTLLKWDFILTLFVALFSEFKKSLFIFSNVTLLCRETRWEKLLRNTKWEKLLKQKKFFSEIENFLFSFVSLGKNAELQETRICCHCAREKLLWQFAVEIFHQTVKLTASQHEWILNSLQNIFNSHFN